MRINVLFQLALCLVISLFSLTTLAAPTARVPIKSPQDLLLDPKGYVHVAEDGVLRSYAANGTVIDSIPLSPSQLTALFATLPIAPDAAIDPRPAAATGPSTSIDDKSELPTSPLVKKQDMPALCQGEYCHSNADCAEIGCPGDSCFHAERWFVKTCHDLMFRLPPGA
ncbi:hypothetical protein Q7P37_004870 [Cladosporium fusiforme]